MNSERGHEGFIVIRDDLGDPAGCGAPVQSGRNGGRRPLERASVRELLAQYQGVLEELAARELVRTKNAPFGDLAEQCALMVYGGTLAPNSTASYDLTTLDGKKVQVKARQIVAARHRSVPFSPMRSLDLDLCLFLLVEGDRVVQAREWTVADVEAHRVPRANRNDYIVKTGQVLTQDVGTDRTAETQAAWTLLLESTGSGASSPTTIGDPPTHHRA